MEKELLLLLFLVSFFLTSVIEGGGVEIGGVDDEGEGCVVVVVAVRLFV